MKLSIIIPIHNREKLLERTLISILQQSYRPLEIILVDNNSTDSSLLICKRFQESYSTEDFHIIVTDEKTPGANAARNKGLQLASGNYLSFYDSDDEMIPERMQLIAQKIKETAADVIATTSMFKYDNGKIKARTQICSSSVEDQIVMSTLNTLSFTAKTSFIKSIGGWNEKVHRWQDWEIGIRILLNSPNLVWIENPALDYIHVHDESITGSNFYQSYDKLMITINEAIKDINESNYPSKKRALNLIYYRQLFLAGLLYQEKQKELYKNCLSDLHSKAYHSFYIRIVFSFLLLYIKSGGRAAWRFARVLL